MEQVGGTKVLTSAGPVVSGSEIGAALRRRFPDPLAKAGDVL